MIVKLHFQCLFLNIEITKLSFFSCWCQYPLFLLNRRGKTELDTWLFFFQKNKAYPLFPFSFLIHAFWSFLVWINITCFNLSVPRPPARPSWAGNLTWLQQSSTPAGLVGIRSRRFVFFFFMVSLQISNGGNEGNYLPHFTVEACENVELFCPRFI